MFTLDQIKAAHSKVKSGADFPNYIQDIIALGVTFYHTFVADEHTVYHGKGGFELISASKYVRQAIASEPSLTQFKQDLLHHQNGGSDYLQFIRQCAVNGVEKWAVCMESMTCTYYDLAGNKVLVEEIPVVSKAIV
jgi:uncharacterized protein YbcV (DUF1398 family)